MSSSLSLADILAEVQRQFHDKPPNGWLLGWNASRCYKLISDAALPYQTKNHTSFDYGFCNWLEVQFFVDGDDRHWTMTIKVSFVVPAYCIHWTEYESPLKGHVIPSAPGHYSKTERRVRAVLEDADFFELPDAWLEVFIQGIELELSGNEHVTLNKCLFSDYEN